MLPWIAAVTLASLQPALAASKDSLTMLEWEGKYQELEKAAESRLAAVAARNTTTLAPLCVAYSRLKRYSKLMSCLNDWSSLFRGATEPSRRIFRWCLHRMRPRCRIP